MPSEKYCKKQGKVEAIANRLKSSIAGVLIDYRGLTLRGHPAEK